MARNTNKLIMIVEKDGKKITYTGDFDKLPRDKDGKNIMTFSVLGDNVCAWGSKK